MVLPSHVTSHILNSMGGGNVTNARGGDLHMHYHGLSDMAPSFPSRDFSDRHRMHRKPRSKLR
jgi:hypothetical protein